MAVAKSRPRSPSPNPSSSSTKRQKLDNSTAGTNGADDDHLGATPIAKHFAPALLSAPSVDRLKTEYAASAPYKHAVVDALFDEGLLESVREECVQKLAFTEKETDIYKVHQTGDLASLSYLSSSELSTLPSLQTLRDALYSPQFRTFIRGVTGCGPLSGTKQDMSVNSYRKGCHLLNHDDVIDTRRVSYIVYMPFSGQGQGKEWKEEWGGRLELYDVKDGEEGVKEPLPQPSKVIPPAWNQFVFFEVQPGHSFHSVEEVVTFEYPDGVVEGQEGPRRERLSISGWFHKPQPGEEGYSAEPDVVDKSSLEQLSSPQSIPFINFPPLTDLSLPPNELPLSEEQIQFLSTYINPTYLVPNTIAQACDHFSSESNLRLKDFLNEAWAKKLEAALRQKDLEDGYSDPKREGRVPRHDSGVGGESGWVPKGPPHRARYCIPESPSQGTSTLLTELGSKLFTSTAFRSWLAHVTTLVPRSYNLEARRFRPGLDYTLATGEDSEARLDIVLGLTPEAEGDKEMKADGEEGEGLWESAECGGWECYMAPHDGEDDPAVYGSGSKNSTKKDTEEVNGAKQTNGTSSKADADANADDAEEEEDEGDDDDDGTLLTVPAGFNQLLLVLRDERVLRFVKYVSASAMGSRWDVSGEYQVDMIKQDDEDEEAEVERGVSISVED